MASSVAINGRAQIAPNAPSSRQSRSFFSSRSFSSTNSSLGSMGSSSFLHDSVDDSSTICPGSTPLLFSGIPYAWEQFPGMPKKHQNPKKKDSDTMKLLPLPPSRNSSRKLNKKENSSQKFSTSRSFRKDPFFIALLECSKDGDYRKNSTRTTVTDRFGFVGMYTSSCKTTCAVSESIVYLPRPRAHYL